MTLKNLRQFIEFKHDDFFEKKKLYFLSARTLQNENGVKVSLLILEDNTTYANNQTNLGEQITVKILNKSIENYSNFQPMTTVCKITNISKATVFGEYQNQLSIVGNVEKVEEIKK